jgi:tRNA (mo5U34)-methyltransferase
MDVVEERIASFPRWHYEFELAGHRTPIFDPAHRNRHSERVDYFFRPLLQLFGGDLRGKRVLDLGCNAGYWSLLCAEAGADYVLGIDGRELHIEQANFVFEVKGIDRARYEFRRANLFELTDEIPSDFDIVLNLGLMYHISKHVALVELIAAAAKDIVVTDTYVSTSRASVLEIAHEDTDEPRNAVDYELVMIPSRQAVLDLMGQFGFETVVLRPRFSSWDGSADFELGQRRAFVSSRSTPLTSFDAEPITATTQAMYRARHAQARIKRITERGPTRVHLEGELLVVFGDRECARMRTCAAAGVRAPRRRQRVHDVFAIAAGDGPNVALPAPP